MMKSKRLRSTLALISWHPITQPAIRAFASTNAAAVVMSATKQVLDAGRLLWGIGLKRPARVFLSCAPLVVLRSHVRSSEHSPEHPGEVVEIGVAFAQSSPRYRLCRNGGVLGSRIRRQRR